MEALALSPTEVVVEIGAGLGALTGFLAQTAARVVALEVDPTLAAYLKNERFAGDPKVEVRCLDVLQFDFPGCSRELGQPLVVTGNLPYQITSPLLFKLAAEKAALSRAVLMVQKEVGDRLSARPATKDYGVLTVLMQYHFALKRLLTLGPANFYPPPQVTSVVMALTPHMPEPRAANEELFSRVVKIAFAHRRKTLRNTLVARAAELGLGPQEVLGALAALGIDPERRGETLSVSDFVRLSNLLPLSGHRAG